MPTSPFLIYDYSTNREKSACKLLRFDLYFSETSGKDVLRYGSFYVMITQETSMPVLPALRRK